MVGKDQGVGNVLGGAGSKKLEQWGLCCGHQYKKPGVGSCIKA